MRQDLINFRMNVAWTEPCTVDQYLTAMPNYKQSIIITAKLKQPLGNSILLRWLLGGAEIIQRTLQVTVWVAWYPYIGTTLSIPAWDMGICEHFLVLSGTVLWRVATPTNGATKRWVGRLHTSWEIRSPCKKLDMKKWRENPWNRWKENIKVDRKEWTKTRVGCLTGSCKP